MAIIKGFIFDLDGVIVDTARYHFLAWQRLADELGLSLNEKQNEALKGLTRRESLHKILTWSQKSPPQAEIENLMARKNTWFLEYIKDLKNHETLPGTLDFLQKTADLNLRIALGSASANARHVLDLLGITHRFEVIIDGTQIDRGKPDPQVFTKAAQALGLEPQTLVVFEDSVAGLKAAADGGFRQVGLGKAKVLKGAELVIKGLNQYSPAEIINKLNF